MKIGLALCGGGARGLAHVTMLEVSDELGVQPDVIAGTSIGAILGAAYASGLSAAEIHSQIHELAVSGRLRDAIPRRDGRVRWLELVRFERDKGGVLSLDSIMRHLEARIPATSFEDLEIPLRVVAADFWEREEIVLESGELMAALRASMALPGVFRPAMWGDRVLIDGGAVNPVPFDLLQDDCDCVVAINVVGNRRKRAHRPPGLTAAIFNTYQVMQTSIVRQKLRHRPPTIYIQPELVDIRMLEFYKADEIFEQARPAKEQLRRSMGELLAAQSATREPPT